MAIRAYSEDYLECAATSLAVACDYAVNVCGMKPDDFADIFVISGEGGKFGRGNPSVVAGKSGIELVRSIVEKVDPAADFRNLCFPRTALLNTGQAGLWRTISGIRQRVSKRFSAKFRFLKS